MKNFLAILLLCGLTTKALPQVTDSSYIAKQPEFRTMVIDTSFTAKQVERIVLKLERSHRQFRTGTIFFGAGLLLNVFALGLDEPKSASTMAILGAGVMTIGGVIHIDSHKHLGRVRKRNSAAVAP